MTPNEMGHYFVLMLFLTSILIKKNFKVFIVETLAIFTYLYCFKNCLITDCNFSYL